MDSRFIYLGIQRAQAIKFYLIFILILVSLLTHRSYKFDLSCMQTTTKIAHMKCEHRNYTETTTTIVSTKTYTRMQANTIKQNKSVFDLCAFFSGVCSGILPVM